MDAARLFTMRNYDTVTEAISDLQQRGYTHNFNIRKDCLFCDERDVHLKPADFEVDEVYRFEGNSDPGDENIVYAISSRDHSIQGVLMNAFGVYAEEISADLMDKLRYDPKA